MTTRAAEFRTGSRTVLVTGASGFVGRHLVEALSGDSGANWQVIAAVFDDKTSDPASAERVVFDITDATQVDCVIARLKPDAIVHLAAQASVGSSLGSRQSTWSTNFTGTYNLAASVARHHPKATFLFASTAEVYGSTFLDGEVDEDAPTRPTSPYARSKLACELMLADVLPDDTRLIVVRPFNHSGPGQDERFVIPSFAGQIARIEAGQVLPFVSVGNLQARRTFLDVRDVVQAYRLLLTKAESLPKRNVFNIAGDRVEAVATILDMLLASARTNIEVKVDPARMRPSDIPVAAGSDRRVRKVTGWSPSFSLERTLADTLDFCRALTGSRRSQ